MKKRLSTSLLSNLETSPFFERLPQKQEDGASSHICVDITTWRIDLTCRENSFLSIWGSFVAENDGSEDLSNGKRPGSLLCSHWCGQCPHQWVHRSNPYQTMSNIYVVARNWSAYNTGNLQIKEDLHGDRMGKEMSEFIVYWRPTVAGNTQSTLLISLVIKTR